MLMIEWSLFFSSTHFTGILVRKQIEITKSYQYMNSDGNKMSQGMCQQAVASFCVKGTASKPKNHWNLPFLDPPF